MPSPGQWPKVAAAWELVGSPLRPDAEDVALVKAASDDWGSATSRPPRVLILGVTPELYGLAWPTGTVVRAVDRTKQMLSEVWPGDPKDAVHADWLEMDWPDDSFDLVLCDGGWSLLDLPGQHLLARRLAKIIAPDGRFVARLFVPPSRREMPEEVLASLTDGGIRDLNCLKLRLGMALMPSPLEGVELGEVWRRLHDVAGSWPALAAHAGWDLDHLSVIDAYRDSTARYHFITVDEFEATMCESPAEFATHRVDVPRYLMGDQCPTVVMRRLP